MEDRQRYIMHVAMTVRRLLVVMRRMGWMTLIFLKWVDLRYDATYFVRDVKYHSLSKCTIV